MSIIVKEGYFKHKINASFKTKKAFYLFFMPMQMKKYEDLKSEVSDVDWSVGMIEKGKMFGNGWIGLASNEGDKKIDKEFIAYKHIGKYSKMRETYNKVMKDYPNAKEFYNLYMTDPKKTPEAENVTYILIG